MGFGPVVWRTAVVVTTGVALVFGLPAVGVAVVVLATVMAGTGAAFGWCWFEDPTARRGGALRGAAWGGCGGAVLTGLPIVIGGWTLLVLALLGATAPVVVASARRALWAARPASARPDPGRLSDRELERRWRTTTRRVRARGLAPARVVALVEERARLLDELERRDPDRFVAWLETSA